MGCSKSSKSYRIEDLYGTWVSLSKEPLNMAQALSVSDSLFMYDPAIGDTCIMTDISEVQVVGDTLKVFLRDSLKFDCRIVSLEGNALRLKGMPWREKETIEFKKQ